MPLLQYKCSKCKKEFEELAKFSDVVHCPICKAVADRAYSGAVVGAIGKTVKKCSGNCKTCKGC